jgi:hypothetical protein
MLKCSFWGAGWRPWWSGMQTDPVLVLALRLHIIKLAEQSVELICCSMHSGLSRIVIYTPSLAPQHAQRNAPNRLWRDY